MKEILNKYREQLISEEKSPVTIEKYLRDAAAFLRFADGKELSRELTLAYKQQLQEQGYAVRSINSMLAALNDLLEFMGYADCKVKRLKQQRQVFCSEERELSKAEYLRLLEASKTQLQLNLILQTICATGIRVSELKYFTLEAVRKGEVWVNCKSKNRVVFVPEKLRKLLIKFAEKQGIEGGMLFVTHSGKAVDRSNIWARMKKLCATANVEPGKVFPHNLRKLFARMFYGIEKDIAKLADILGHSSIETTRIYIMTSGSEHRRTMEKLRLVI